ncbi:hypothetical protein ES288_A10G167400v1 [Gossypium darwinii]|uniref:Uncharacterized protein n=1 Tax=Gossypium darwinii TaxID=34276 RepID=A0A5D2EZA0_GOSDA|nr:hypothetical protein ES288_A10G167400v1 [Gossypium darwinii]TYG99077.1 hypothetical protein ES288_A10G167400v1 [Gossypium darwinii]TYG99078.1 hypothetical protein ES288_A10G167400v1 [Gossypium darwinii]
MVCLITGHHLQIVLSFPKNPSAAFDSFSVFSIVCYPILFIFHKAILNLAAYSIFPPNTHKDGVVPLLPGVFLLPFLALLLQFYEPRCSRFY